MPRTRLGTAVCFPRCWARTWSIVLPTRISPWSVLTQAPESMLGIRPRWGLLCRAACSLNSPLTNTMSSRKGIIGFRPGPISIEAPSPLSPTSAPAPRRSRNRRRRIARAASGGSFGAASLPESSARTGNDSSQGRVKASPPPPRRNPRRLIGLAPASPERSVISASPRTPPARRRGSLRSLVPELLARDDPHDQVREAAPPRGRPSSARSTGGRRPSRTGPGRNPGA